MSATAGYARSLSNQKYHGNLDYFVQVCEAHQRALSLMADSLDEVQSKLKLSEERNAELLRRNQHLTDRVLRYALGKPQEIPPEPPEDKGGV
jgi:hypothetical protein